MVMMNTEYIIPITTRSISVGNTWNNQFKNPLNKFVNIKCMTMNSDENNMGYFKINFIGQTSETKFS